MKNIWSYLAIIKLRLTKKKWKKGFFFAPSHTKNIEGNKVAGIPVIVLDLYTNKSIKYASITQAAKSFDTHPKTIWRKVQNKQRYLERYLITEKYDYFSNIYINIVKYINIKLKVLIVNNTIVLYILLMFMLLVYILYKYVPFFILLYTDICNNYTNNIDIIKVENIKFGLEQKSLLKMDRFNYLKAPLLNEKVNGLVEFNLDWRSECLLKNKSSFLIGIRNKLSVYQSIINELNLDFQSIPSRGNSLHSSPIIERININNIFSNAIASTRPTISIIDTAGSSSIDSTNSLVINTQSIFSNRNYSIIDNTLIWPRSPGREVLNYNSNVLYCLINGLSPTTY